MEENKVDVTKKSNKIVFVLVSIILFVVGICLGFYVGTNDNKLTKQEDVKTEENKGDSKVEEVSNISKSEVDSYFEEVENYYIRSIIEDGNYDTITPDEVRVIAYFAYLNTFTGAGRPSSFTAQELSDALKNSVYSKLTLVHGDIYDMGATDSLVLYKYDASSNTYVDSEIYGGSKKGYFFNGVETESYAKDGKYIVVKYGVYSTSGDIGPDDENYYKYPNKSVISYTNPYDISDYDKYIDYDVTTEFKNDIEGNKSKLTKITYTFVKENDKLTIDNIVVE